MKEKLLRKTLVTLLALVLIVTLGFGNLNVTQAEDTGVETEKVLLQCDEDWTVFKHIVEEGAEPKFEVMYKGQTVKELEESGEYLVRTKIFVKNFDSTSLYIPVAEGSFYVNIGETLPPIYEKKDFVVCFSIIDTNYREQSRSNYFSFFEEDFHITYWDLGGYENAEWRPETGKFEVKVKFSEQLQGDISIDVVSDVLSDVVPDDDERNNFLGKNPIENISYQNYSEEKTVDGESYTMNYSLVSFEINALEQVYGIEAGYTLVKYIINFNNVVSSTGAEVKPLIFKVDTPMIYDSQLYDPTIDEPTTEEPTTDESTTEYVEPTTEYIEPTTPHIAITVQPTTTTQSVKPTVPSTTIKAGDTSNNKNTKKTKIKVKKIKLKAKKTLKAGKKLKIKATVTPKKATNKKLTWKSSNKKYATVNSKGVVKAKKAGKGKTVKITAKAKDGSGKKATIKIKIV